jgi:hypothetical protein
VILAQDFRRLFALRPHDEEGGFPSAPSRIPLRYEFLAPCDARPFSPSNLMHRMNSASKSREENSVARKLLASSIIVLALLTTASASLTEVRQDFLNQTATFSSTSVMTAPTSDGSYLITVYLDQPAGGTVSATIGWTDENGNQQQFPVLGGSAWFAVRLKANTAVTVATTGTVSGTYNLFVDGMGFWN